MMHVLGSFSAPQLLSIAEWSLFSLYWSAASKNASPARRTESGKSRRVHVVLVNLALLLVALPIRQLSPRFLPNSIWIAWLGLSIQTASGLFAIWARRHLAANWSGEISIKVDHELIRSGPYHLIRHPIYTGMLGMFVGATVVAGRYQAIFGLLIVGFAYSRKIRLEEAILRNAFGTAYDIYGNQAGALIPKLMWREAAPIRRP